MTNKAIILDLDDTIFETRTVDKDFVEPFLSFLRANLKSTHSPESIDIIIHNLWSKTWDSVIDIHQIDRELFNKALQQLEKANSVLNINPYSDYEYIRTLDIPKFLVTTSVTSLQKKKIAALGLQNDFEKIIINDPFIENKGKRFCFEQLMDEYNLVPAETYVVGDNYESEIEVANQLNMISIQMLRKNVTKGNNAAHYIDNFYGLERILFKVD